MEFTKEKAKEMLEKELGIKPEYVDVSDVHDFGGRKYRIVTIKAEPKNIDYMVRENGFVDKLK